MSNEIAPKKSLGQHWLNDEPTLDAIADAAELDSRDVVLEIGPGLGSLTAILTKRVSRVIAVELDKSLAESLPSRLGAVTNLEVVQSDILTFDFTTLPVGYKLVANIPYYLTSNLVKVISETTNSPNKAVLLVAQEVAQRAAASSGQMSLLSVSAQFYWQVTLGLMVPARLFTPSPKIDSQLLILTARDTPLFSGVNEREFFRLVKAGFAQRRKTLLNSLSAGLGLSREQVADLCKQASLVPTDRAQSLSLEDWCRLYLAHTNT